MFITIIKHITVFLVGYLVYHICCFQLLHSTVSMLFCVSKSIPYWYGEYKLNISLKNPVKKFSKWENRKKEHRYELLRIEKYPV